MLKNWLLRLVLWISNKTVPVDIFAKRFPISVKGIIINENKVLLLKTERSEWDLPGGKINDNESAESCLIREVKEETNLDATVKSLLATFTYDVQQWVTVFVLVYQCENIDFRKEIKISGEHLDYGFFSIEELTNLKINQKYKEVIISTLKRNE